MTHGASNDFAYYHRVYNVHKLCHVILVKDGNSDRSGQFTIIKTKENSTWRDNLQGAGHIKTMSSSVVSVILYVVPSLRPFSPASFRLSSIWLPKMQMNQVLPSAAIILRVMTSEPGKVICSMFNTQEATTLFKVDIRMFNTEDGVQAYRTKQRTWSSMTTLIRVRPEKPADILQNSMALWRARPMMSNS